MPVLLNGEFAGLKRTVLANTAKVVVNSVRAADAIASGCRGDIGFILLAILYTYRPNSLAFISLTGSTQLGSRICVSKNNHKSSGLNSKVFDRCGAKDLKRGANEESSVATNVPGAIQYEGIHEIRLKLVRLPDSLMYNPVIALKRLQPASAPHVTVPRISKMVSVYTWFELTASRIELEIEQPRSFAVMIIKKAGMPVSPGVRIVFRYCDSGMVMQSA
jgi:hypothetical protein